MDLGDVYESPPPDYLLQEITFNQDYTSLLNALKDLTLEKLDSGIEALRLDSKVLGLEKSPGNTLYICSFYSALFDSVMKRRNCVLTGNPGVSKSWFQLYMLYRFINRPKIRLHSSIFSKAEPLSQIICGVFISLIISRLRKSFI